MAVKVGLANGAQLSPTFISKRREIFQHVKKFRRKPRLPAFAIEYQRIPTLFNFNQPLPTDPDVCPTVGKR